MATTSNNISIETPPVLHFDNDKKFRNNVGEILEVDIRGNKHTNRVFFNVKDIYDYFGIELSHNDFEAKYTVDTEYKYFEMSNDTNLDKLFFTYDGFHKFANNTDLLNGVDIFLLNEWLFEQFDKFVKKETGPGKIYYVTSDLIDYVKLGIYKGSDESIFSGNRSFYGPDIELFFIEMTNPKKVYRKMINNFAGQIKSNGMYDKTFIDNYLMFIVNNSPCPKTVLAHLLSTA